MRDRTGAGVGQDTSPTESGQHHRRKAVRLWAFVVPDDSPVPPVHRVARHHQHANRRLPGADRIETSNGAVHAGIRTPAPDSYAPAFAAEDGLTTLVMTMMLLRKRPSLHCPHYLLSLNRLLPWRRRRPATAPPLHEDMQQIKAQMKQKELEVGGLKRIAGNQTSAGKVADQGRPAPSNKP